MKPSRYNYYINCKGKHLFFNGISKRFFEISSQNSERIKDIITNPDEYKEKYAPFIDKMKEEGLIIEDGKDENEIIRTLFEGYRNSDTYMLMILPTYRCNLSCWYCTQEHQNENLTENNIRYIKRHIEKYLMENKIKQFRLSWFGGEPLIGYKAIIDITKFANIFCAEHAIGFICDITTNSLLLNEERIKELGDLGIKGYQITIDGCREKHNKVKILVNNSAFDKAIENVLLITKMFPETNCTLRFNYNDGNLESDKIMNDLNALIPEEYRSRITFLIRKIWQEDEAKIDENELTKLVETAKNKKYRTNSSSAGFCYVDWKHFNCVFPNGKVGKCDNDPLVNAKGVITEEGEIVWDEIQPFILYSQLAGDSPCKECKHLPFCGGPCPTKRNDMVKNNGRISCIYANADLIINNMIVKYCESEIKR